MEYKGKPWNESLPTDSAVCSALLSYYLLADIRVVSVVEVLEIIQYSALVVRSGYTGNVVVLRVACTRW